MARLKGARILLLYQNIIMLVSWEKWSSLVSSKHQEKLQKLERKESNTQRYSLTWRKMFLKVKKWVESVSKIFWAKDIPEIN